MKKVLFVLPTLFNRSEKTIECVDHLLAQCKKSKIKYKICVVSNIENERFTAWKQPKEVDKIVSGWEFNIAAALNAGANKYEYDYFAFVQDDMFVIDDNWIENFINIYEKNELNCGVLGVRPHTMSELYANDVPDEYTYKLTDLLWTDGVMFFKRSLFEKIDLFDDRYFGDRESQDFCYRAKVAGYTNYMVGVEHVHRSVDFRVKADNRLLPLVEESKKLYEKRWRNWEIEMVRRNNE